MSAVKPHYSSKTWCYINLLLPLPLFLESPMGAAIDDSVNYSLVTSLLSALWLLSDFRRRNAGAQKSRVHP